MPFPVHLLLTRSACLKVIDDLQFEREGLVLADMTLDRRADVAGRRATSHADDLTKAQQAVTEYTNLLAAATPGSETHTTMSRKLQLATRRVEDLTQPASATTTPEAAFLKAVNAEQAAVQVPVLDAAIAEVQARHDALPA